ncbi:branched-chain amino acid ABC transporter ATP-binding protein [Pseudoroseomonas rhizosphaerae]|uniref:Branched-chain amino acid ABC transporter ATP-binding protein n=1 Tax=Teichococcus rhizosphaerae TaxID=1335062 RepID=A0A2C6Y3B1_9PROT|nr:branched-chain amino acid ABC transporter ATP-binding protein/permease [Pseudoroseomonas rhizosphaerae]PHK95292.1 branched-chain amino acid ABC transporter ATP-binding protein [Pseudoroseomonas rhizosphaerae]
MSDRALPTRRAQHRPSPGMLASLALLPLLFVVPLLIGDDFVFHVFITICLYGALATAWNIVGGFAGQLSLGHAIFYGIGAYTAGLLVPLGISPWLGMLGGAALSAMVGVAIGLPCFRLRGPFFALATIAFLQVIRLLALHFTGLTGGAVGLMVPLQTGWEWMIFFERWPSLLIAFGLLALTLGVTAWLRHARFGYYLVATCEREPAAAAAGVDTLRVRLQAVALSAALTSMVGTFHGMYLTFIEPEAMFSLAFSVQIAMFALIGGIGTVMGPLIGTLLVVPLTELARGWLGASALGLHGFVYGTVLVLIVLFVPDGLVGLFRRAPAAGGAEERGETAGSAAPASVPAAPREAGRRRIGEPILVAEHLHKHFGGLAVTQDVSLTLRQGEVLGIIGPNGAGKTTLFNQLSGFLAPASGTVRVRVEGEGFIRPATPHAFARAGVGRTFQIVQPFAAMTVLENIMIGAFHNHPGRAAAREKALETAHAMGLWAQQDMEARSLTIGGLKRLEIARVMAMEPRILLLDEVMAGLNQTDVQRAIRLVEAIRDSGVSVIAIEHVMQAIMALSDRVVVLNSGRVIAEGRPQEVVRDPVVIEAYLGEDFVHAHSA